MLQRFGAYFGDLLIRSLASLIVVLVKSIVFVPMVYLFCWLTGRHHPSHDLWLGFFLGAFWFTDVSRGKRDQFIRGVRRRMQALPAVSGESPSP